MPQRQWLEKAYHFYEKLHSCEILHFENGAPFLRYLDSNDHNVRISISHSIKFLVIASSVVKKTFYQSDFKEPEIFGIDAENIFRDQVLRVRERFLSTSELSLVTKEDVRSCIIAWTCKEAILKASQDRGIDFRNNITIKKLPVLNALSENITNKDLLGEAILKIKNGDLFKEISMYLFSYLSESNCITIAFPDCFIHF